MTGKELKKWLAAIPDDAVVAVDGRELHIKGISCQSPMPGTPYPIVTLDLITTSMGRKGRPFPDAETR